MKISKQSAAVKLTTLLLAHALATLAMSARADVRLPSVLGDHMVLQQHATVLIWGWAASGETVTVTASWGGTATTTAGSNGEWKAQIRTPRALALDKGLHPETITIEGKNKLELKDVLIGEVWLCSGQSNMEMHGGWDGGHHGDIAWKEESTNAVRPGLRLFDVANAGHAAPQQNCRGAWQVCSPASAGHFSASGYFFGANLQERIQVPVGLVSSDVGGTPVEKWISKDGLATVPEFARAIATNGTMHQVSPTGPGDLSVLFNAMIAPLKNIRFKGAIWYQGESNVGRADLYVQLFPAMIRDWRRIFDNDDMAFYFVQIAPWRYGGRAGNRLPAEAAAELREAQTAALKLPRTGMAVINDIGEPDNIHPRNKHEVGRRLALQALEKTYDKDVEADGPTFRSVKISDGKLLVTFRHADGGLVSRDGKPLTCFEIAGADGKFVPATAEISGADRIIVSCPEITAPVSVRFAWGEADIPDLSAKNGLPAAQFRASVN